MEKLPGKGMVTVSSVIMLIWGLVNAGYYDVAKLVLADDPSSKAIACGVVVGIASLAAVIGGIFGIAGSNKVAKASAIVVWAAFLLIFAIVSGIVALVAGDSKIIGVVMMIVGIIVPFIMFMGASKNRASNSYRFFQNRECKFFPCHEVQDEDDFNCLFCYCPLYLDDNCIGSPEYIITGRGQRIKDCSSCLVVHSPEMYDKVIAHLRRQDEILRVDLRKMKSLLMDRLFQITHINDMDEDMRAEHRLVVDHVVNGIMTGSLSEKPNSKEIALDCTETVSNPMEVSVLLQPFAGECVHKGYLEFGNKKIECNVLEQIDTAGVEKGYLYAFHAPDVDL